jgi:FkbM family methyltransferase
VGVKQSVKAAITSLIQLAPDRWLQGVMQDDLWSRIRKLKEIGFDPKMIIDVGAYRGNWSVGAAKIFSNANVLMIEAQSSKARVLADACTKIGDRARSHVGLLSLHAGVEKTFYDMETGSSYYEELSDAPRRRLVIVTETLDDVAAKYGVVKADLLKVDAQGAELDILRGGHNILRQAEVVLLEISLGNYNRAAPNAAEVISFMHESGFLLRDLADVKRLNRGEAAMQADAFFIRRHSSLYGGS